MRSYVNVNIVIDVTLIAAERDLGGRAIKSNKWQSVVHLR